MIRRLLVTSLCLAAALTTGCARIRVHRSTAANPPVSRTVTRTVPTAIFGLQDLQPEIDLLKECGPDGWQRLTTESTAFQSFLHAVTLNLYQPWTATIECAAPKLVPKSEL